ncbi:metal-dependent hydrolase [Methanobacterium aggregans]|uniref:metal-dependent hydrolase n=1 Tax=Methanobacterium aggregans TaxID=1615586 RepID=UPI001AE16040|nr:metal-dependent hydrolase [Methanobacterium aggregans]MBP2046431.1 inner membrane protein [Methanobacterium aggregans]
MDLITHFIVPYAILTLMKSKNRLEGALGGIAPDFDVLIAGIGIIFPELFVFSHRGITHSFLFGFVTVVIFLYLVSRKPVKETMSHVIKRDFNVNFTKTTVLVAYFGVLTHLFLDFLTSKGIPLFYPFILNRFSAELYSSLDFVTICLALAVIIVLYLKVDSRYKNMALAGFVIVLIIFGGVRAYEKMDVLGEAQNFSASYTNITAYPSSDMFSWYLVENSPDKSVYRSFKFNNLNKGVSETLTAKTISISNGSYQAGLDAVKEANSTAAVQRFKWNAFYPFVNAKGSKEGWNVTYFDIVPSYNNQNITVYVSGI